MTYVVLDREAVGEATVFVLRMVDDDNRFHADSLAEWHAALDEVESSEGAAALVTTGNGKFYSNGFALERLIEEGTVGEVIPDACCASSRRCCACPATPSQPSTATPTPPAP